MADNGIDGWIHDALAFALAVSRYIIGDYLYALEQDPLSIIAATIAGIVVVSFAVKAVRRVFRV